MKMNATNHTTTCRNICVTCDGDGDWIGDNGPVKCPDCGGSGIERRDPPRLPEVPLTHAKLFRVLRKKMDYLEGFANGTENQRLEHLVKDVRTLLNQFERDNPRVDFTA